MWARCRSGGGKGEGWMALWGNRVVCGQISVGIGERAKREETRAYAWNAPVR